MIKEHKFLIPVIRVCDTYHLIKYQFIVDFEMIVSVNTIILAPNCFLHFT